jgi:putative DNA primase/helicase
VNIDLTQARQFLQFLHGDADKPVCFQVFHDSKVTQDTINKSETFHAAVDDCVDYFNAVQSHNYGVYVTLNKTDGRGREAENIINYRVLFADLDNLAIPEFPIQPHMITQRDALHSHCYWLVNGIVTDSQFSKYQKQVAMYIGSDEQVFDPSRVVRLAGSCNMKNPAIPALYNIVQTADHEPFTTMVIDEAFKLTGEKLVKLTQWSDNSHALETGEGFNDDPINRTKMISWLGRAEPAIKGNGRSYMVIKVASMGLDLGIPLAECQELMWEHYNDRMFPPYEECDRNRKLNKYVKRAYKYANNAVGCRTTIGVFSALRAENPLPTPTGGWEENAKLGKKRAESLPKLFIQNDNINEVPLSSVEALSNVDSALLITQLTNKSPVWDMALAFIAKKYPNGGLKRNNHSFYAFTGKCWEEVQDAAIRSDIVWFFKQWKFPPSKISQILTTVEDAVYIQELKVNTWLEFTGESLNSNFFTLKNCLLEVTVNSKCIKHSHTNKYFSLTALPFDYKPDDIPLKWLKFIQSTFEEDINRINRIQELIGYSLLENNDRNILALFNGVSRSGKSVISNIISELHGKKNVTNLAISSLNDDGTMIKASNSSLIIMPECNGFSGAIVNMVVSRLKAMTGGDSLSLRQPYSKSPIETIFGSLVIMVSNVIPDFKDPSLALSKRMEIIPFNKSFSGIEDRDILKNSIKELPAIFNWALKGLERLNQQDGFTKCKLSENALLDVSNDMYQLSDFILDMCEIDKKEFTCGKDAYKGYLFWCELNFINKPLPKNKFTKELKSHDCIEKAQDGKERIRGFKGFKLKIMDKPKIVNFPKLVEERSENTSII